MYGFISNDDSLIPSGKNKTQILTSSHFHQEKNSFFIYLNEIKLNTNEVKEILQKHDIRKLILISQGKILQESKTNKEDIYIPKRALIPADCNQTVANNFIYQKLDFDDALSDSNYSGLSKNNLIQRIDNCCSSNDALDKTQAIWIFSRLNCPVKDSFAFQLLELINSYNQQSSAIIVSEQISKTKKSTFIDSLKPLYAESHAETTL